VNAQRPGQRSGLLLWGVADWAFEDQSAPPGGANGLLAGRLARKQRKKSETDLAERVGIARSTLQLIEKGHAKVEIALVFEAATVVGLPLFVDDPARPASEISRRKDKLFGLVDNDKGEGI
jgi:DNA-binding XRE family transcriptional regulator